MALLDFLKRKKEVEKSRPKGLSSEKKTEKVSVAKKVEKKTEKKIEKIEPAAKSPLRAKSVKGFSFDVIKQPHISEKGSYLAEKNQYVFQVNPNFNKAEIKKSVEGIYRVDVLSVNIVRIPSKKRRLGKTEGFRKGYKKAIVKIKDGQKIEIL